MRILFIVLCLLSLPAHADDGITIAKKWHQWVTKIQPVKPVRVLSGAKRMATIRRVHLSYATFDYEPDKKDEWATPEEFKKRLSGDCEDFALAKYQDLLEEGVPDSDMYFTVLAESEPHAVLIVKNGSESILLDSKHPLSLPRMIPAEGYKFSYQANLTTVRWHNKGNLITRAVASPLRWK